VTESTDRFRWTEWIDRLNAVLAFVGGIAALGLMVNVVLDVLGRTLLHHPIPPTLDLTQFTWMPVLVSLGLGYTLQRGEHIRVNLLTSPTGSRTQRLIEIVSMAVTLATVAPLAWYTAARAQTSIKSGEAAVSTEWLLLWPFRWIVVIGLIGLFLQAIAQLVRAWTVPEFVADDDDVDAMIAQEESLAHELVSSARSPQPQETVTR
jgi:TRAP-type mannitol/chloroaromatic compound transport system, small permease component